MWERENLGGYSGQGSQGEKIRGEFPEAYNGLRGWFYFPLTALSINDSTDSDACSNFSFER